MNLTPTMIEKLDALLANGLVRGSGNGTTTFCVEEACAAAVGLPVSDRPECVEIAVRSFGVRLNDARWPSEKARAEGMRDFAVAQLGSTGVVNGREFAEKLAIRTVREVLPHWLRYGKVDAAVIAACENATTRIGAWDAAMAAERAARTDAAYAAAYAAADAAYAAVGADAAYAAAYAAADAAYADVLAITLPLSARIATEILREMGSPGAAFL